MCRQCLLEVRPDRARFVAESGAYLINYAGCFQCSKDSTENMVKQPLKVTARNAEEDDDDGEFEETITYSHSCSICEHVIAEHYYSFRVSKKEEETAAQVDPSVPADAAAIPAPVVMSTVVTHDYLMECVLCGKGADEQVHHSNDRPAESAASSSSSGVGSSSTAPAPVASISLGAIQLPNVPAAAQPKMDAKEEEEWA